MESKAFLGTQRYLLHAIIVVMFAKPNFQNKGRRLCTKRKGSKRKDYLRIQKGEQISQTPTVFQTMHSNKNNIVHAMDHLAVLFGYFLRSWVALPFESAGRKGSFYSARGSIRNRVML